MLVWFILTLGLRRFLLISVFGLEIVYEFLVARDLFVTICSKVWAFPISGSFYKPTNNA